jgi:hypothetical protein
VTQNEIAHAGIKLHKSLQHRKVADLSSPVPGNSYAVSLLTKETMGFIRGIFRHEKCIDVRIRKIFLQKSLILIGNTKDIIHPTQPFVSRSRSDSYNAKDFYLVNLGICVRTSLVKPCMARMLR